MFYLEKNMLCCFLWHSWYIHWVFIITIAHFSCNLLSMVIISYEHDWNNFYLRYSFPWIYWTTLWPGMSYFSIVLGVLGRNQSVKQYFLLNDLIFSCLSQLIASMKWPSIHLLIMSITCNLCIYYHNIYIHGIS